MSRQIITFNIKITVKLLVYAFLIFDENKNALTSHEIAKVTDLRMNYSLFAR